MTEVAPKSPDRFWIYVGVASILAWLLFLRLFAPPRGIDDLDPPRLQLEAAPTPAAFDWTLEDLDGKPVPLSDFKGKAILLNLWSTTCPPCVEEMPSIDALASNPKVKDVAILCVSTDPDRGSLRRWLEGKNWGMTVLRANDLPEVFATPFIPVTFLISPAGKVIGRVEGAARWDHPSAVEALVGLSEMPGE